MQYSMCLHGYLSPCKYYALCLMTLTEKQLPAKPINAIKQRNILEPDICRACYLKWLPLIQALIGRQDLNVFADVIT